MQQMLATSLTVTKSSSAAEISYNIHTKFSMGLPRTGVIFQYFQGLEIVMVKFKAFKDER